MGEMDLYLTIAVIGLMVFLVRKYMLSERAVRKIPGPKGYPIIGSALQIKPGNVHETFSELARQFGEIFEIQIFNAKIVVLNSVDIINKTFTKEYFDNKPKFFLGDHLGLQQGITFRNADKDLNYVKKAFTKGLHVYGSGIPKFEKIVKVEIDRVMEQFESFDGEDFEVVELIRRSIINVISILIIGEPATDEDVDVFTEYLTLSERDFMNQFTNTLLTYLPSLVNIPYYRRKMDRVEYAKMTLLEKYFHRMKESRTPGTIRGLTDWFLQEKNDTAGEGSILTDELIQAVIFSDVLGAGAITTSATLPSIILCLVNHPGYQTKLQEELERVIGDDREPSVSDRHECSFTEAVIMETMRYITPVPFPLPHVCSQDTELEGYTIEADTQVLANVWYIHHDESIWRDPWTFRPERFLDDDGKLLPNNHVYMKSWLPFGIGRRRCPGMGLATTRIFLYIATMLQRWTFVPSPGKCGTGDPGGDDFDSELLFKPKPFYCIAKRRN